MALFDSKTLSFTCTAMPRSDLFEKTINSFFNKFMDINFKDITLFINIDPFPDNPNNNERNKIIDISTKYFGKVISNLPDSPNFAKAVKWVWAKTETKYIFHLEDDWELLAPFSINNLIHYFYNPKIKEVSFRAWKTARR